MISASLKSPRRTALITGAANGLGYELGKLYARAGYDLVLVDKDRRRLKRAANALKTTFGAAVGTLVQDLAEETAPDRIAAEIEARHIRVDVILNRAGYRIYGPFTGNEPVRELRSVCRAFHAGAEAEAGVGGLSKLGRLMPGLG